MSRAEQVVWDWSGLRPSRMVLALILINVGAYVLEMIGIRAGWLGSYAEPLALVPEEVAAGRVWQVLTSIVLHSPQGAGHLVGNMFWLWIFGAQLEREVGERTVSRAYLAGGLGGSTLQILLGALGVALGGATLGILDPLWTSPVVGASGAVNAITFTWLARHYYDVLNMLFIGPIRGRTLMLVFVLIELLNMLSLGMVAWGAHLGGMAVGLAFGFGWFDRGSWRRRKLAKRGRAIESQLRVLEGGKRGQRGDDEWVN